MEGKMDAGTMCSGATTEADSDKGHHILIALPRLSRGLTRNKYPCSIFLSKMLQGSSTALRAVSFADKL